ncbi:MAG: ThuA domain-containing protein [Thermoguttaceae bacterium]
MKSCVAACLALAVVLTAVGVGRAEPPAEKKIRVLLTYGGHDFEQGPLFAMFDALPGVTYTKALLPKAFGMLKPGLEKDFDVIVRYDMVGRVSPEEQQAFVELLERGIGLVALHHSLGAHPGWSQFRDIVGGVFCQKAEQIGGQSYGPSGWEHGQQIRVTVADKEHPITAGLADFTIHDEVYNKCYISPDVRVLLRTDNPKNNPQIAWVKQFGNSRVFYFQLGHDSQAWRNPAYPEILARGIRWAAAK